MNARPPSSQPQWYCLRTQSKHEHIAAAHLREDEQLEVFLPRIRFRRRTRTGPRWVTEAMFPGYLFARFTLAERLRRVQAARGVRSVVHFGTGWPTVPDLVLAELQLVMGDDVVHVREDNLQPGDAVTVASGAFAGLEAVVVRALPARMRVAVLLEFLGRQTAVELPRESVSKPEDQRGQVIGRTGVRGGG